MNKNFIKTLLFISVMCILTFANASKVQATDIRLAGETRYETALAICDEGWKQSDWAVLTYGENYPDALTGAALAAKTTSPLLLVGSDFNESSLSPIKFIKLNKLRLLGGKSAVNDKVLDVFKNCFILPELELRVTFLDVGQGDSILVQQGEHSMLIDAGNNTDKEYTDSVKSFVTKKEIRKLDYVIGSIPADDHIGGMAGVINAFSVGKIYMPKVHAESKAYNELQEALKNKGIEISSPMAGESFKIGDAVATIFAPVGVKYDDIRNYSIVIKVTYGKNSFLFAGDAGSVSETEMLQKGYNLSSDVLKVGDHGSDFSTGENFLKVVNPKYAVISSGYDSNNNRREEVNLMQSRLRKMNIATYRTDGNHDIVMATDGEKFTTISMSDDMPMVDR